MFGDLDRMDDEGQRGLALAVQLEDRYVPGLAGPALKAR
jgi:hypothetical protein